MKEEDMKEEGVYTIGGLFDINEKPSKLKVGQKVTTQFNGSKRDVVWTITKIIKDKGYGSGLKISAGVNPCKHCGAGAKIIEDIDGAWFLPILVKSKKNDK